MILTFKVNESCVFRIFKVQIISTCQWFLNTVKCHKKYSKPSGHKKHFLIRIYKMVIHIFYDETKKSLSNVESK